LTGCAGLHTTHPPVYRSGLAASSGCYISIIKAEILHAFLKATVQ
jgi:hypothetical protein